MRERFREEYGIDVDDPWFTQVMEAKHHLKHSYEYTDKWKKWVSDNKKATWQEVLQQGKTFMWEIYNKEVEGY